MKKKNVKYEVGKGSIKRPTNPSDSFRKSKKKMTPDKDAAYDKKHGIMDKKKQKTQKQVIAHKASSKKQAWMEKVGKGGKNC